jgi:predicted N-acetyltransferase YhbS
MAGALLSGGREEDAPVVVRAIRPHDVETCARIAYAAHSTVATAHNLPCEHPSVEFSIGLFGNKVRDANAVSFVAECGNTIVGSNFLNFFPSTPVAVIGPLTVDPAAEGRGAGRLLMDAALAMASERGMERVRLVQSPSHFALIGTLREVGVRLARTACAVQRRVAP